MGQTSLRVQRMCLRPRLSTWAVGLSDAFQILVILRQDHMKTRNRRDVLQILRPSRREEFLIERAQQGHQIVHGTQIILRTICRWILTSRTICRSLESVLALAGRMALARLEQNSLTMPDNKDLFERLLQSKGRIFRGGEAPEIVNHPTCYIQPRVSGRSSRRRHVMAGTRAVQVFMPGPGVTQESSSSVRRASYKVSLRVCLTD